MFWSLCEFDATTVQKNELALDQLKWMQNIIAPNVTFNSRQNCLFYSIFGIIERVEGKIACLIILIAFHFKAEQPSNKLEWTENKFNIRFDEYTGLINSNSENSSLYINQIYKI